MLTQTGINWFSAGINKPNASCLLEPVATAIVMFVLIYCSLCPLSAKVLQRTGQLWGYETLFLWLKDLWNTWSNPYESHFEGASVKRVLHALFVKWCTRRLSLDIYNRISFLGDFRRSIFHPPQQENERWARRIFHLACCWTSMGTDVHLTAFTAAGSDLEQLLGQITKPTFNIRDPQDFKMVDSGEEMSSYKHSQKCLFLLSSVGGYIKWCNHALPLSCHLEPLYRWRAQKGP